MLSKGIAKLVQYGIESGLTPECERRSVRKITQRTFFWMYFMKMNTPSRRRNFPVWIWKKL